jgi:hypothetical protein
LQGDNGRMVEVGRNDMRFGGASGVNWNLTVYDKCDGTYLKWINEYGTWSYWLFNAVHREQMRGRTVSVFSADFESIGNTTEISLTKGKQAERTRTIYAERVTEAEMAQLKSLFTSPRVELYNGNYGDAVTADSFQTVLLKDGRYRVADTKRKLYNVKAVIDINHYTQM